MKLSIVIVNWNSKDYLRKCLMSLISDHIDPEPQIIVVDGGSFDGCGDMLSADFPEVEFVQSQENIGFGRSNNLGFGSVRGDAVLLLNPDTEVFPGAVRALLDALNYQSDAGLVGARLLNTDGTLQRSSVHPLPTPVNTAFDSEWLRKRWWARSGPARTEGPLVVEAVSGACMLMRSKVFNEIGGFNPAFFMYAEDMDLCLKIRRAGLHVYHVPVAVVIHHGGGSSSTRFSKFATVMIREAVSVYMKINHGPINALFYRFLMGLSAAIRLLLLIPAWVLCSGEKKQARHDSIGKWWATIRWVIGKESWARVHFQMDLKQAGSVDPEDSCAEGVASQ